jgi:hypothetical protein
MRTEPTIPRQPTRPTFFIIPPLSKNPIYSAARIASLIAFVPTYSRLLNRTAQADLQNKRTCLLLGSLFNRLPAFFNIFPHPLYRIAGSRRNGQDNKDKRAQCLHKSSRLKEFSNIGKMPGKLRPPATIGTLNYVTGPAPLSAVD